MIHMMDFSDSSDSLKSIPRLFPFSWLTKRILRKPSELSELSKVEYHG